MPITDLTSKMVADQGTPGWVKVFGIVTLLVIVLFVILVITGGHDPGGHLLDR